MSGVNFSGQLPLSPDAIVFNAPLRVASIDLVAASCSN